jgi:hypothetical protein
MTDGETLPIAYYGIVSASRNEVTVVAERPEILVLIAGAGRRIEPARGVRAVEHIAMMCVRM